MRNLHMMFLVLTIFGGINLGLVGLLNLDLITLILGTTFLTKLVHVLIGISAVHLLYHTVTLKDTVTTS